MHVARLASPYMQMSLSLAAIAYVKSHPSNIGGGVDTICIRKI